MQIHHFKDLTNWDLVVRPLNRKSQFDMRGNPDSCGIWAPWLSHDGEKFQLVYTDVRGGQVLSRIRTITSSMRRPLKALGPILSITTFRDLTLRCSTTTTAAIGSSTCSGITVADQTCLPASFCRNLTPSPGSSLALGGTSSKAQSWDSSRGHTCTDATGGTTS